MNDVPSANTQDIYILLIWHWVFLNLKGLWGGGVLLQTWAYYVQGKLEKVIDAEAGEDLNVEEACRFLKVGLLCAQDAMKLRPNMASVVLMLIGEKGISVDRITKPAVIGDPYLDRRPSNADSTTMKSFATTEALTSSEANTEWSL